MVSDWRIWAQVELSPDGRILAAGYGDGSIGLWNLASKDRPKRTLSGHAAFVRRLRFTPDGKTLISSSDDGTLRLWNPNRERAVREIIPVVPAGRTLVFDLDRSGKYLAAAGDSPVIYLLRLPPSDD